MIVLRARVENSHFSICTTPFILRLRTRGGVEIRFCCDPSISVNRYFSFSVFAGLSFVLPFSSVGTWKPSPLSHGVRHYMLDDDR